MSSPPRILVVDDQPANLIAMRQLLKPTAATVMTADSGEEALALCMREDFILALIDVRMPGMDGFELAEYLRGVDRTREIPLLFVTAALSEDLHKLRGYELGGVDYIQKPVDDRILLSKVKVFLDLYTTREELFRHRNHLSDLVQERSADLEKARQELRTLDRHLNLVREEERRRIARALHDEMGNTLANIKMTLEMVRRARLDPDSLAAELLDAQHQVEGAIAKVRHITLLLRPPILDQCDLLTALEWQADEFEKASGVACVIDAESRDVPLDEGRKIALFRILQESLTNVGKHAQATEVHVSLNRIGGMARLTVQDNGQGIAESILADPLRTLGLRGMEERACQNGGELHVESTPSGTCITVVLPAGETP